MLKKYLKYGIFCVAGLFFTACATTQAQKYDTIPNNPQSVQCYNEESQTAKNCDDTDFETILQGEWKITAFCHKHTTIPLKSDVNHTFMLRFEKGVLTGSFGCNNFFGSYAVENGNLKVGNAGMTRKMCEENIMEYESKMTEYFLNATTKILTLKDTDTDKMGKIFFLGRDFYLVLDK